MVARSQTPSDGVSSTKNVEDVDKKATKVRKPISKNANKAPKPTKPTAKQSNSIKSAKNFQAPVLKPLDADKFVQKHIHNETVESALNALREKVERFEQSRQKKHDPEVDLIAFEVPNIRYSIQISLTIPPKLDKLRPTAIKLNHSYVKDDDEVILIVKDPQRLVKDYLAKHGSGGVTRVLGVEKLKKRYGTHEGRRELMALYDHFLVDQRVAPMMPQLLGRVFINSKKMPLSVNMDHDVTEAVKRTLSSTAYTPRAGTSVSICIGAHHLTTSQMVENVLSVLKTVIPKIERGAENILSICIKADNTSALPIFTTQAHVMKDPNMEYAKRSTANGRQNKRKKNKGVAKTDSKKSELGPVNEGKEAAAEKPTTISENDVEDAQPAPEEPDQNKKETDLNVSEKLGKDDQEDNQVQAVVKDGKKNVQPSSEKDVTPEKPTEASEKPDASEKENVQVNKRKKIQSPRRQIEKRRQMLAARKKRSAQVQ